MINFEIQAISTEHCIARNHTKSLDYKKELKTYISFRSSQSNGGIDIEGQSANRGSGTPEQNPHLMHQALSSV